MHQHAIQAVLSNVPLHDSAQLLQQGRALNKTPAAWPVLHSHP
jgi:hypothetical protein